jgi:hypothetical protein
MITNLWRAVQWRAAELALTLAAVLIIIALSCKFQVFYWAHYVNLWNGTIPYALYVGYIALAARQ